MKCDIQVWFGGMLDGSLVINLRIAQLTGDPSFSIPVAIKLVEKAVKVLGAQAPVAIYDEAEARSEPEIDELADVLRSRGYAVIAIVDGLRKHSWLRNVNYIVVKLSDPGVDWLKFKVNEIRVLWGEYFNWFPELGETNVSEGTKRIVEVRSKPKEVLGSLLQVFRQSPPWFIVVPPRMQFTVPIELEE